MSLHAVPRPTQTDPPARPLWRDLAGAVFRERRRGAGLRLRDVAERAGISVQYLSEVERGRKEPSSEMLESICGALDMDLLDLMREAGGRLLASRRRAPGFGLAVLQRAGSGSSGQAVGRPDHRAVRMAA
jgi:ribosome-binding protein aMBF1 (putative translation factor)